MYYVLAAALLIIVYLALAKLLSSLVKGCLVTLGIFLLIFASVVFLKSTKEPVLLFEKILIDNFKVSFVEDQI